MEKQKTQVDQQHLLKRLESWNESLERELDYLLRRSGISGRLLEDLPRWEKQLDEQQVRAAREQMEAQLAAMPEASPRNLQQPTIFDLASTTNKQLLRA
jgi:hypothetical protein